MIRLADERDAAAVQAIYAPYVRETAISFEEEPPSATELGRRIETISTRFPWLVAETAGALAQSTARVQQASLGSRGDVENDVVRMCGIAGHPTDCRVLLPEMVEAQ